MLDQQPASALAIELGASHAHQHPAALEPLSVEREFQLALAQGFGRRQRTLDVPVAAIPQLHCATTVLSLGDISFEIPVVERVILHLDREALVVWIEGWAFCHRPGLKDAVEFEAQIVMQATGSMFLNNEAQPIQCRDLFSAARLTCL